MADIKEFSNDAEYLHQFDFLKAYNLDFVLKCLATYHACRENSAFPCRLTALTLWALSNSTGNKIVSPAEFRKTIMENYYEELGQLPQENLYVDVTHANGKTYRIFPGGLYDIHQEVTRLFRIIEDNKLSHGRFGIAEFLLSLSNNIGEKLGYQRSEIGFPDSCQLFSPDNYAEYLKLLTFTRHDLEQMIMSYGGHPEALDRLLLSLEEYKSYDMDDTACRISAIEQHPFYELSNGNILIRNSRL